MSSAQDFDSLSNQKSEIVGQEPQQNGGEDEEGPGGEYEIEEILEAKKGQLEKYGYRVSWKGYGPEHNSWVNEEDAGNAQDLIDAFWESRGGRPPVSRAERRARKSEAPDRDDDEMSAKKPRRATGKRSMREPSRKMSSEHTKADLTGMRMPVPSWNHLIRQIDTVERIDNTLYVFFTLHNGERVREETSVFADKCPKLLITFYEANL
ncbi:chromatin-associated protein swi6, partial [Favolaschia claudopus]